jgi:hypothetical protein
MPILRRDAALKAVEASIRAKYRHGPNADRERGGIGRVLSLGYRCWCAEPVGHDWPGKADGEPHPR